MKLCLGSVLMVGCATLSLTTAQALTPNLRVTGIKIVDVNDKPIVPVAGQPFFVEIDWSYSNPVCTNYTLTRVVNGWTNTAPPINYGCGHTGTTSWAHVWGAWVMYKAGTYPITVIVDSGNSIAESSETDNNLTTNVVVQGSIVPEWALVNVEFGRTNLGGGTDVIVGTMDDAFDYLHPWYTGNDSRGRPRLIAAAQNALGVGGSPTNSVHSTAVMGIVLARGANNGDITGLVPDARYVSAEFI
jgi:CARDB